MLLSGKVTDPSTDSVNTLYATDQILNMTLSKAGLESFPKLTVFKYVFFIGNLTYSAPKNCSELYCFTPIVFCHLSASFERF